MLLVLTKKHSIMGKIYGLFGAMTGKTADVVMAVRNGEQIVRKYQPVVSNPSTPGQVAQRAKLKLMSQLSAVMAPVIAIPRTGGVSPRNWFTKLNIGAASYSNDTASIDTSAIKVTKSDVFIPTAQAGISSEGMSVHIPEGASLDVDKVIYIVLAKGDDNKVRLLTSQVVEKTSSATFEASFTNVPTGSAALGSVNVLYYGIRANSDAARAKFADMTWASATAAAQLVVSRTLLERDYTLTETRPAQIQIS